MQCHNTACQVKSGGASKGGFDCNEMALHMNETIATVHVSPPERGISSRQNLGTHCMKDMALWNEGDWIAAIALVVLVAFLAIGGLIAASRKPEFLGHPKGLYMLFFAEMW